MKELIEQFRKTSSFIESNIFRSVQNVNLNLVIGYKDDKGMHSFLDHYEEKD